jgi:HlyD family secretion protein
MSRSACLLIIATATLGGCGTSNSDFLPGTIERDRIEVSAETTDPIVERRVNEGQVVKRGDILLVQDTVIARAQMDAAQATVAQQQAQLSERTAGARSEDRAAARARVERARVQLQVETREWQRLNELVGQKLISESALARQKGLSDAAAASLREAEQALAALMHGTRPEQIAQARQSLEQARAQQRELAASTGRLTVAAPVDGIVDALPYQVGERPARGGALAVLLASGAPFVRAYLPEPRRAGVKVGVRARVHVDGVSTPFDGVVRYVSSEAAYTPYYSLTAADRGRLAFRLEVTVSGDAAKSLPSGLPADVELLPANSP